MITLVSARGKELPEEVIMPLVFVISYTISTSIVESELHTTEVD